MTGPRKKTRRGPRARAIKPLSDATTSADLDDPQAAQAAPDGRKVYQVALLPRHAAYIDQLAASDRTRTAEQWIELLVREAMQAHKYRTGQADVQSESGGFSGLAKNNPAPI